MDKCCKNIYTPNIKEERFFFIVRNEIYMRSDPWEKQLDFIVIKVINIIYESRSRFIWDLISMGE